MITGRVLTRDQLTAARLLRRRDWRQYADCVRSLERLIRAGVMSDAVLIPLCGRGTDYWLLWEGSLRLQVAELAVAARRVTHPFRAWQRRCALDIRSFRR